MAEQESDVTQSATQQSGDPYLASETTPLQLGGATAAAGEPDRTGEKRMSFLEHLVELRVRLRNAALAFTVAMIASFIFVQHYFDWLTRPVRRGLRDAGHEMNFYAKSLTEPFWVYMKLAIVGGLLISAPFIFWELWRFVAPGLYRKERRIGVLVATATGVCFLGGAAFAYSFMCEPAAYYLTKLCTSFAGDLPFKLDTMLMMDEVANFQMMTLAGCGLAFELPGRAFHLGLDRPHQQPGPAQVQQVRHRACLRGRRRAHAEHGSFHPNALGSAHFRALQPEYPGGLADRARPAQTRRGPGHLISAT